MSDQTERKPRLLVVDDDDDFRSLVKAVFVEEGFETHDAGNGEAALAQARQRDFDIIILDVKMPKMDGIQALRLLREESPTTEYVMMTGVQDLHLAVESIRLGAREYLTKPVEPMDLVARMRAIMRAHVAEARLKEVQTEFSSRLLHELLSPLLSVKSAIEFLLKKKSEPLTDQQSTLLAHVSSDLNKMESLLNDMIDLTKFESGRVNLEKLPSNLDELVPTICGNLEPRAKAKHIQFSVDVSTAIPTVELDPEKVEQVIVNLVDNAIKYTNDGGDVCVSVRSVQLDSNGKKNDYVQITIKDSGGGISADELPYLFDKYKELLTGKTSVQRTTGLGLAICKSIVEAHRGRLTVESALGEGTTFHILLPVESA